MGSMSNHTLLWLQSYLDEQRQLIMEFLSLQEQGGIPSNISIHLMRGWILSNARTAFLSRFQETVEGNHLHFLELVWKVKAYHRLRELEQGVLRELHTQPCESFPFPSQLAACTTLMGGDAGHLTHTTLQRALSDMGSRVRRAETQSRRMPRQVVVHSQTIKHIISQVLLHVNHQAFQQGLCPQTSTLVFDAQERLWCLPWVQVTEEKQMANALLQSSATYQVAQTVVERLEQVLAPRPVLERALASSSNILSRYLVHLVTLTIAQVVPDQLSANQEERLISERAAVSHPLPPKFLISRELVEDFLVSFLLKLHPLNSRGVKQLSQQELLAMTVRMTAVTLATLERVPGVTVDQKFPAPLCNMRRTVLQLQNNIMKKFGTVIKVKKLVGLKDPAVLTTIPQCVVEGVLRLHQSLDEAGPAGVPVARGETAKAVEEAMEDKLFSQHLPEVLKKTLFQQYGTWICHTATFQRAFPKMADQDVMDYRCKVLKPRFSNRDVVWVERRYLVCEEEEEEEEEWKVHPANNLVENHLALNCSLVAFNRQVPRADFFEDVTPDNVDVSKVDLGVEKPSAKVRDQKALRAARRFGTLIPPAQPWAGDCPEVSSTTTVDESLKTTPLDHKENPVTALGQKAEPLVQVSMIRKVLTGVFEHHGWPWTTAERKKQQDFHEEMVEHTHLLLQREAERYRHNRVFLNTLRRFSHPEEEATFCRVIAWSIKVEASSFLPTMKLNRANLLKTPQLAVMFCSIIAAKLMANLKPSVRFAFATKKGDDTPYCINIPVKREASSDRPQTRLEMHVERHRRETLEELSTPVVKDREYWGKRLRDLYIENGALPKELQELGKTFGYSPKDFRRKRKSCTAWLRSLFRQK